jgi:hypothetical protein
MRQLTKTQSAILMLGGLLMVIGAFMGLFRSSAAVFVFAPGVIMFISMQMLQRYDGENVNIRRLRRFMLFSDALLLLSALLMYASTGNPFQFDHITYVQYIGNNWVVALLIAALLQLYTTFRIGKELEKES